MNAPSPPAPRASAQEQTRSSGECGGKDGDRDKLRDQEM